MLDRLELIVAGGAQRLVGDLRADQLAFVDRAALRPGPVAAYISPAGPEAAQRAAQRLGAAAARAMALLGPDCSVSVTGDGMFARLIAEGLGVGVTGSESADAVVETTGDPRRIVELLTRAPDLSTIVLACDPAGLPVEVDAYGTIHFRGLRIVGIDVWREESQPDPRPVTVEPTPVALGSALPSSGLWLAVRPSCSPRPG